MDRDEERQIEEIQSAYDSGYDTGYYDGQTDMETSLSDEYDRGWQAGHDEGYDEGYQEGTDTGFEDGYDAASHDVLGVSVDEFKENLTALEHNINLHITSPVTESHEQMLMETQKVLQAMLKDMGVFV